MRAGEGQGLRKLYILRVEGACVPWMLGWGWGQRSRLGGGLAATEVRSCLSEVMRGWRTPHQQHLGGMEGCMHMPWSGMSGMEYLHFCGGPAESTPG